MEVVKLLLSYLSEDDIKSVYNRAFRCACENGHTDICQLLIDNYLDLEYHPLNKIIQLTPSLPPK